VYLDILEMHMKEDASPNVQSIRIVLEIRHATTINVLTHASMPVDIVPFVIQLITVQFVPVLRKWLAIRLPNAEK
jgi:hypothetical protein